MHRGKSAIWSIVCHVKNKLGSFGALKLITIILGFAKMDQRKTPIPNLEFVKIINVTNKHCHMCCEEFSSVSELHVHINNDH